jgi:hypothetical protein
MPNAQVGSFTSAFEATATPVGAGIVLGSVALGVIGLVVGWPRRRIGERALTDGYIGGLAGLGVMGIDLALRYLV